MTEFTTRECLRLIDKLKEVDPTTEAYHILLSSIERFDAIYATIDAIAQQRENEQATELNKLNVVPFEAASFPEEVKQDLVKDVPPPEPEPPKEEKVYESSDVRTALCDARTRGVNVGEILRRFGVDNFQNLPAAKYGALIEALEAV